MQMYVNDATLCTADVTHPFAVQDGMIRRLHHHVFLLHQDRNRQNGITREERFKAAA
jgi:hypothetical protein